MLHLLDCSAVPLVSSTTFSLCQSRGVKAVKVSYSDCIGINASFCTRLPRPGCQVAGRQRPSDPAPRNVSKVRCIVLPHRGRCDGEESGGVMVRYDDGRFAPANATTLDNRSRQKYTHGQR